MTPSWLRSSDSKMAAAGFTDATGMEAGTTILPDCGVRKLADCTVLGATTGDLGSYVAYDDWIPPLSCGSCTWKQGATGSRGCTVAAVGEVVGGEGRAC